MFHEFLRHRVAYTILFLLLGLHVVLYYLSWPDVMTQRIIIVSMGVCYFLWGIFAHVTSNHLNAQIAREYFTVALLACGMLLLITM